MLPVAVLGELCYSQTKVSFPLCTSQAHLIDPKLFIITFRSAIVRSEHLFGALISVALRSWHPAISQAHQPLPSLLGWLRAFAQGRTLLVAHVGVRRIFLRKETKF